MPCHAQQPPRHRPIFQFSFHTYLCVSHVRHLAVSPRVKAHLVPPGVISVQPTNVPPKLAHRCCVLVGRLGAGTTGIPLEIYVGQQLQTQNPRVSENGVYLSGSLVVVRPATLLGACVSLLCDEMTWCSVVRGGNEMLVIFSFFGHVQLSCFYLREQFPGTSPDRWLVGLYWQLGAEG